MSYAVNRAALRCTMLQSPLREEKREMSQTVLEPFYFRASGLSRPRS